VSRSCPPPPPTSKVDNRELRARVVVDDTSMSVVSVTSASPAVATSPTPPTALSRSWHCPKARRSSNRKITGCKAPDVITEDKDIARIEIKNSIEKKLFCLGNKADVNACRGRV
jgi:hypothetical protein